MGAMMTTGRLSPMNRLGTGPVARSDVSWVAIRGYGEWWRGSSGGIGRPNRSPAG